jgi:calmodulin
LLQFADVLGVAMNVFVSVEKLPDEITEAFRAYDTKKTGKISARALQNVLCNWGESLTQREVQMIFREANVHMNGDINYNEFLKIIATPTPDYS